MISNPRRFVVRVQCTRRVAGGADLGSEIGIVYTSLYAI